MLHTQRRMGQSKGNGDARIMHDAIIVAVSKIRKMRTDMESQALSVARIRKDARREAIRIDGEISHEASLDASKWMQGHLEELKTEIRARHGVYNKLHSERQRLEIEHQHLKSEVNNLSSDATVQGHETSIVLNKIDHDLNDMQAKLEDFKSKAAIQHDYSRVLAHLKSRTKTELDGVPGAQRAKFGELDKVTDAEQSRIQSLLRSEKRRMLLAERLNKSHLADEEARLKAEIHRRNSRKERALAKVQKLEKENPELIKAFELFAAQFNEHDVDKLTSNFIEREAHQEKLKITLEKATAKLQEKRTQNLQLCHDLEKAKLALHEAKENSLSSAKNRKRHDELVQELQPKRRAFERQKAEMENRFFQLKSIQDMLLKIKALNGKLNSNTNGEKLARRACSDIDGTDDFRFPNTSAQDKPAKRKPKRKKVKRYSGKVLPVGKVIDTIAAIYESKVRADKVDDASGNPRNDLADFTALFFSQQYGSIMQKSKLDEFRGSLQTHIQKAASPKMANLTDFHRLKSVRLRMKWFSVLIGWNSREIISHNEQQLFAPYHPSAIDAYLKVVSGIVPINSIEEKLDELSGLRVDAERVIKVLGTDGKNIFGKEYQNTSEFFTLVDQIRNMRNCESTEIGGDVDFDEVMNAVLSAWYKSRVVQPQPSSAVNSVTSVDLNDEEESTKILNQKKLPWLEENDITLSNLVKLSNDAKTTFRS
eukprot:g345.t1